MLKLAGRSLSNLAEFVHGRARASAGKNQHRSQDVLVVVQVALALVLLVSSGLMIRTFQNLRSVEPGFTDPATVQTVRSPCPNDVRGARTAARMQRANSRAVGCDPRRDVGRLHRSLPMQDGQPASLSRRRIVTYATDELPPGRRIKWISPGLFQTFGTPLLAGRDFEWAEFASQRNVALVSESFARETWNTVEGAVGKRIRIGTTGPGKK